MNTQIHIGPLDLKESNLIQYDHYTLDQIADMGGACLKFVAEQDGEYFEVMGSFTSGSPDGTITVSVGLVSKLVLDEDGDVDWEAHTTINGVHLSTDPANVLTVITVNFDFDVVQAEYNKVKELFKA